MSDPLALQSLLSSGVRGGVDNTDGDLVGIVTGTVARAREQSTVVIGGLAWG